MPHSEQDGPLAKRQKTVSKPTSKPSQQRQRIFAPYRTIGLVSSTDVPFTTVPLGKTTFQLTTSVGRSLQTYDLKRGLNLVFITRPQTPYQITATCSWRRQVLAAWGDHRNGESQGIWIYQRGKKVGELALPADLDQPIKQLLVFGSWIIACCSNRIEVFKNETLEHYTTLNALGGQKGDNELTEICTMPTYLNKIFAGRRDGWVEIWNVSTGNLIYTILPPSPKCGAVTCLQPSPALSLMAISYANGALVIQNVLTDKPSLQILAGDEGAPVTSISFRTDGQGAGPDGRKDGVMATATNTSGDVTFWDLNGGGRVMGILRSAHNPPSGDGPLVRGGINKVEFLAGQPVIVTSGHDNSLKTWIFDETPFSPIPRILHSRSGHAGPVTSLQFLPSDFDGAEAGNKWLLSAGQDRSLWGWSLRRDGQSTELSQGNIRKKAKKYGILANEVLRRGPTTSLDDLKAPEITCIACSLNRDGGMGAIPGKQALWQKNQKQKKPVGAEISGMTGWESVVTAHKDDSFARTWFWGRKRAGRWAFQTTDQTNVSTVAMSPCGTFAVVGSTGGGIDMFNLQSGLHRQRFPSALTPAQARQARLQQLKQASDVAQLEARSATPFGPGMGRHTKAVTGIAVDSMNKFIISCGLDGKVKFWEFLTGRLVGEINWAPMTAITACRYHAANDLIAFACDDLSIRVVDVETKQTIREFWGCEGKINDFTFSNDGRWIVAASQDGLIRVWDLPTSHLIDAIRLEKPCTALAFSATGEYLAASCENQLGVNIWTNKTLFTHVPTRQISEKEIAQVAGPTSSGEGGQGLVEAAFEEPTAAEVEDAVAAPTLDQLSADMMTLSVVPRSRWQTLLHLDLIKQRNKPKEAPKLPEKAPFFLLSATGPNAEKSDKLIPETVDADANQSRIMKFDMNRQEEAFTSKLRAGAASGNYDAFIDYLKVLSPSSADLELRSLSPSGDDSELNELLHFIRALTNRLKARRDYELTQAWMTVFLRLHFDMVMENDNLMAELAEWKKHQAQECDRIDNLVGYCGGVVGFLRSPRT
ncbi:hypothetical protein PG989_005072 [Apiospora arundinis]|uniref:WD domain-containing protein n=1 Tax=Apiospora arundinis TaxID=335852 RepID=A0ABR2ITV7_9PEZI